MKQSLIIIAPSFLPQRGGAETFSAQLAEVLAAKGIPVEILTAVKNPELIPKCRVRSAIISPSRLPGGWFWGQIISAFFALLIRAPRGKVIFFPQLDASIVAAWLLRPILGFRYMVRVPTAQGPASRLSAFRDSRFANVLMNALKAADTIIIQNPVDQSPVQDAVGNKTPISLIPNGVDINLFPYRPRKEIAGKINVGSILRLEHKKGADRLLNCLQTSSIDIHWHIVGSGTYAPKFAEYAQQNQNATYTPEITHQNIPSFLKTIDILVNPSRAEGLSNITLEAMASGIPVISSDIPNNRVFWDHAVLLDFDSPANVINAIRELKLDSEKRKCLSKEGRYLIEHKYNLQVISRQYQDLFFGNT